MKALHASTLLIAAALVIPSTASACGGYGAWFQPVDSTIADLVGDDPRAAGAAFAQLVGQGDQGVRRLERAVAVEQQRLDYRTRMVTGLEDVIRTADPHHQHLAQWRERLQQARADLAQTNRILAIGARLLEPLKAAARVNAVTA